MRPILVLFFAFIAVVSAALAVISRLITRRETTEWRDAQVEGKIAEIDGVGLHYVDRGSGPAVLLIHGFGGHTFSFRHTIPALEREYRVVAVDLMGFGFSERPKDADYSLAAHADRVLRLMDHLGIDKAAAVGHSMGGEVVMRMASIAPDRIARLVLAGSVSGDRVPTLPTTPLIKPFLPAMARLTSRLMLKRSVDDPSVITPEMREGYLAPMRIKGSIDGLYQILRDGRGDGKIDFDRITQPVLILWAENERIVPRVALSRLRKRFPNAEVVIIEDAGHLLLEEQPAACNAAILKFFATPSLAGRDTSAVAIDEEAVHA
jgi:pimeloyl-ACP methyl ester carboxylesterase